MTITVSDPVPEVEPIDIAAQERWAATLTTLAALAGGHNLRLPYAIHDSDNDGRHLHMQLPRGRRDLVHAWANVLGLPSVRETEQAGGRRIVTGAAHADYDGAVWLGWRYIYLVSSGCAAADAELVAVAALAPDAGDLPADPSCVDCGAEIPGASADPWLRCGPCAAMTSVQRDLYLAVLAQKRDPLAVLAMYEQRAETDDIDAVKRRLGLLDREEFAGATVEQANARRAEIQAAIEAYDLHPHASAHVVEGACTGAWWVEIRDADENEIVRLAVHDGVWWTGGLVIDNLHATSKPAAVALYVSSWLSAGLPAELAVSV